MLTKISTLSSGNKAWAEKKQENTEKTMFLSSTSVKIEFLLVCLGLLISAGHFEEDLYKVLGVRKSASVKEIKKAYKQLAKEW